MIKHAILGGFKNLIRSFWISATAITVLTVSLSSVALVASLSTVVGFTLRQFDNQISVLAYFREDVEQSAIDTTIKELKNTPDVKSVKLVTKEDAKKELANSEAGKKALETIKDNKGGNPLLNYLNIAPTNTESYSKIIDTLNGDRYKSLWDGQIENKKDFIANLQKIYRWTNIGGLALVVVFGLVSILVMANILRITIYGRKDEIEIMRLVGGTNGYIRGPFIFEGALYNIIASLIVAIIFVPSISLLIPWVENYLKISTSQYTSALILQMYLSIAGTIVLGTLVGIVTAYFATKRYLKL
jgi:cell division transport system permease protein